MIRDLRRLIAQARIDGTPIERIVFDEIDAIEPLLPNLAHEPAFTRGSDFLMTLLIAASFALRSHAAPAVASHHGRRAPRDRQPR